MQNDEYIAPIEELIACFRRLPGVGRKTAARYAFSVLSMNDDDTARFAETLRTAKGRITFCKVCGAMSEGDLCGVCSQESRDRSVICVVRDSRTMAAVEKVREYNGLYHVLGGVLSPMNGIGPDDIRIAELVERVNAGGVREIILATNPDVEGETTARFIAELLRDSGVKITRLAYGVPVGADLEYADAVTLTRALDGRKDV